MTNFIEEPYQVLPEGRSSLALAASEKDQTELLTMAALGRAFAAQHGKGRRVGFRHRLVLELCQRIEGMPTFETLLYQLELAAARRRIHGEAASPVESVDRIWELVTIHEPAYGRRQMPFGTLRNLLTFARRQFTASPKS
jgi:hypothetical protein